ncbi:MAG: RagB/SusD family nutrient uptake outer membrane protein [Bacteroidota bacterium]|nr:RagB/SusD family nutrient uptake outer membrane protein [Bacteroidota bacterium]
MKKYFSKIIMFTLFVLSIIGFVSCTDYLDKAPLSDISSTDAYKNFINFQGFTEELYNCIPIVSAVGSHNSWNLGDDEYWEPDETRIFAYNVDQGDYWAWNTAIFGSWFKTGGNPSSQANADKGNLWGLSWYGIRKTNIGIANLDKLTDATDEEKNLIAGQLYFFRGWFHFMLMQYWGGLPYINMVLPADQVLKLPRLTYQATADSAAKDFQRAANLLPIDWDQTTTGQTTLGNNNFRINKIMALAYLGKDLLWAGSPLMNSVSTGDKSYNKSYCKKSADAFALALHLNDSTHRYELADFANYSKLFYTYNQNGKIPGLKEAIFLENLAGSGGRFRWNQVNDYRPMTINASGIKVYPTANYVDNYGMANGLPITDPLTKDAESGYDPEYPWKNRDPRFYNDIVIDGAKCCLNSTGKLSENQQYASLYTGGLYRTSNGPKGVLTGYMSSKFVSKLMNDYDGYKDNNTVVISFMRLADVYLMYAEATAEGYGSPKSMADGYTLSAEDAINKIRDRAGVGHVDKKFLGNSDDFMSEVRRERAVELAFEGHRFVDLRRWLLLTEKPYTLKMSVDFDRAGDVPNSTLYQNPQNGHLKNFRETVLLERHLGQRHYWFPFLKSDVNMYKEFTQNPGW